MLNLTRQRLVLLGSYGLKICEGIVTVYGATLHASDKVYWVHAPHCHALPIIRVTESAIVEFHQASFCQGLRQLERLNPVFARLWNEASTQVPGLKSNVKKPETFQLVRQNIPSYHFHALTLADFHLGGWSPEGPLARSTISRGVEQEAGRNSVQ